MNISRILAWFVGLVVIVGLLVGLFYGIYVRPFLRDMMVMKTTHYDSHLTLVTGGGGNSGILESDSLVLVIDTKLKEGAKSFKKDGFKHERELDEDDFPRFVV